MQIKYRPEIDGLRSIAVSIVIIYHAKISILGHKLFEGGFIGVDIFFVISGYLITSIILKELNQTGSFSFKNFYIRRIRRILPALLLVMFVSLPFAWMYIVPLSFKDFSKSIIFSLGFSSNYYFHFSGLRYGDEDGLLKPFLHTWSLSVEEQFYIFFPAILLLTYKYLKKYLLYMLLIIFMISLIASDLTTRNFPSISFYSFHTRIWELLAGSILSFLEITKTREINKKSFFFLLPTVGIILISYSAIFFNDRMHHPSFNTVIPVMGVCLIICYSNKDELITKILSSKLFVKIGLISYSLYLWHYPIFAFARRIGFGQSSLSQQMLLGIIIVLLSIFTYYFVEQPARKQVNFQKILLKIFTAFFLLIIFNLLILLFDGVRSKSRVHPLLYKYDMEHKNFKLNYNYNSFDNRENIFIVGNSFADDLLNLLSYNEDLNDKYYFYTAHADNDNENYQVECLRRFFVNDYDICGSSRFSFLRKQFDKADYIIFAENLRNTYIKSEFIEIISYVEDYKKPLIIFLDDIYGADLLDDFLLRKNRLPNSIELVDMEKKFFEIKTNKHAKKLIDKIKKKLSNNNVEYVVRSEFYCDYFKKKCSLLKDNNKIYSDWGHLTDYGAKFFSNKGKVIIDKLTSQ